MLLSKRAFLTPRQPRSIKKLATESPPAGCSRAIVIVASFLSFQLLLMLTALSGHLLALNALFFAFCRAGLVGSL